MKKYAVIPDIHGQYDLMMKALAKVESDGIRKVIFLGDYVHRGPRSPDVLSHLMNPPVGWEYICLRGNHEDMEIDDYGTNNPFIESQQKDYYAPLETPDVIRWMESLPLFHFEDDNIFAHAAYDPAQPPESQHKNTCIWYRWMTGSDYVSDTKFLTHGHTPHYWPNYDKGKNRLNLDIGGMRGKELLIAYFEEEGFGPCEIMHIEAN